MADLLTKFIAEIKTTGLMRTANYSVEIAPPKRLIGDSNLEKLQLFCDSITIPGVILGSNPTRTYGEIREAPYEKLYGTISLTFFVDNDMETKKFFDKWINIIQNPKSRNFEYYENYISDIIINVEDLNEETRYSMKVFECYPKSITPIMVGYGSSEIMKVQVEFNYKYWQPHRYTYIGEVYQQGYDAMFKINQQGYDPMFKTNYFDFQQQFNSYLPETANIFTGVTFNP